MSSSKQKRFEFRIIAGEFKGVKIISPDLGVTRPPLSRLRRAIFDSLNPYLAGASYLDLFSGTGSYLFEAVSRGAAKATGVEMERQLADAINNQAEKLGVSDRLACLCADVVDAIQKLCARSEQYDLIMMAPPQYKGFVDHTLRALKDNSILSAGGMVVCQHDTSETDQIDFRSFQVLQQRKYGNTTFTFLEIASPIR
ncbi:MAG: 16S rRNA (guanine(966)-N(2))-methyltransferase RsmD [Candidatus Zixiibacteriota bacterium]|nr:MAG: 16S rRNA (guanine(966)-N(2))-methyltransferase RsmD [candidate division Zixibacteria bacterium]